MNTRRLRNYLFFGLGIGALGVGSWAVLQPTASPLLDVWAPVNEQLTELLYLALLAGILLLAHLFRILTRDPGDVRRRQPLDAGVHIGARTTASQPPTPLEHRLDKANMDISGRSWEQTHADEGDTANALAALNDDTRRLITFGWKARAHTDSASEATVDALDALRALAITAVTTGDVEMDRDAATEAIDTGAWTDDRVAAAFLATEGDDAPEFTVSERLSAWVFPSRAFDRRVARTLDAIDDTCSVFLSHPTAHTAPEARTDS